MGYRLRQAFKNDEMLKQFLLTLLEMYEKMNANLKWFEQWLKWDFSKRMGSFGV